MESCPNLPVQVLSCCDADGRMEPLRFRLEDEDHLLRTVSISQVIRVSEVRRVGVESLTFLCRAELGGRERLLELRYGLRTHRWVLLRLLC